MLKLTTIAASVLAMSMATAPPAGRPPVKPLERHDPLIHAITFEVTAGTTLNHLASWQSYRLRDAAIVMPVIKQSTFSKIDPDSLQANMWLEGREQADLMQRSELKERQAMNTHAIHMPIERFDGMSIRWDVRMRVQTWASRLDHDKAMELTWPREWPEEVREALRPQMFIESDDEIFKETVDRVSEGRLRLVSPYVAAKELVRFAASNIQVTGSYTQHGPQQAIEGLNVQGARETVRQGVGSPNDLVCVAVAMLRAAELPARPVIGLKRGDDGRTKFITWAEVHLPDAGWVPFDPNAIRGIGPDRDPRTRWAGFGTMRQLNQRIPLSYHFTPATAPRSPLAPSVWGWDPGAHGDPGSAQRIRLSARFIRRGEDDPE